MFRGRGGILYRTAMAGLLLAACSTVPAASPGTSATAGASSSPTAAGTAGGASPTPTQAAPSASSSITSPCPPPPWTLASILAVPAGYEDGAWDPQAAGRAQCFGHAGIRFTAQVWFLMNMTPGVEVAESMGQEYRIRLYDPDTSTSGWVPAGAVMDEATRLALGRTGGDGGLAMEAWFDVTGHFNDPAAADCRPRSGDVVDGDPVAYSAAEAVAFCLDQFVLERLQWVQPEPTPIPTLPPASTAPAPPTGLVAGKFPGVCPGESMIRAKFPCVTVALGWTPAPDTVAIYRIYQNWTGEGPDAKCAPMGELVYTTDVGVRGVRFVLPEANLGGGGRCLYIEAANRAGASAWVRFDDDFTTP